MALPISTPRIPAGPLNSIVGHLALDSHVVRVYFGKSGEAFDDVTGEGFTAYEWSRFQAAFALIEAVADIDFRVVYQVENADFRLVLDTDEMLRNTLGYFYGPGSGGLSGVGVFNGAAYARGGGLEPGSQGFATITHELLHGLGLMHPHDNGGRSTIMAGVTSDFGSFGQGQLNQGIFTTMSYNPGYQTGQGTAPVSRDAGHQSGPMALDIAALQLIYGAADHATGANVYRLPGQDGAGVGWQAIWDTGGSDRIQYIGSRDATIDLRAAMLTSVAGGGGYVSAVEHVSGGFTIAHRTVIEQGYGSGGDDVIIGNAARNRLVGGGGDDRILGSGGNDWISGGLGDDAIYGGSGNDVAYGDGGDDLVTGNGGTDLLGGGAGNDRLAGGTEDDRLFGQDGDDRLYGQDGDDRLYGDRGADRLIGGEGADLFVFRRAGDSGIFRQNSDTVLDFQRGVDRIDLSGLDGDARRAGDQALHFNGRGAFDGADRYGDVRIQTRGDGVLVLVDLDGDGGADMQIAVTQVSGLASSDFIL
ncbi:MAG: M10 family metallopeptidase C-terminal domain-containing protein [Alphaproteobacteria bacterium]|nr:M10 family metallopeptidase C-terminal domain-containing protein [Alphaproteobacteria bacterium]